MQNADIEFYHTIKTNYLQMKKNILLVRTAGAITTLFCVFHLSFYWLFHWKERLSCLDTDTWAIFHAFNYGMNMMFILFALISLFMTKKLLTESLGKVMLVFMSSIYVMRIVSECVLWKCQQSISAVIIIVCLLPVVLYLLPLFGRRNNLSD
jgi:hypothetical protein